MEVDDATIEAFRWRLAETIAWCQPRASLSDPANCLRTPALLPQGGDYLHESEYSYFPMTEHEPTIRARFERAFEALSAKRARLLREDDRYPPAPAAQVARGALLDCTSPEG